jgi:hypothetical protein
LSFEAIVAALGEENHAKCDPPLPGEELRQLAEHVISQADRANFSTPGGKSNSELSENTGEEGAPDWEPSVPFHEPVVAAFPTEALPDCLRDYVDALATETQTPPDLAAMVALSVVSAACAKIIEVRVRPGWLEPVNIYVVVSMDPGNRKSQVFRAATAPLEAAERAESLQRAPEILAAKSYAEAAQSRLHQAQVKLAKASPEERSDCEQELERAVQDVAESKVPAPARFLADDVTAEKLTSLLAEQDGRLAVMSAEGDPFDMIAGRYTAGGMSNLGVFLKGHAGDTIHVDRIGRPAEYIERPALTMCVTVQPEVIRGLLARPEFKGRGLLGRFLFALPRSLMGRRKIRPDAMSHEVRATYTRAIEKLAALPPKRDVVGTLQARELTLSRHAQNTLEDFERELEPQLGPLGALAHMTDWAGKLVGGIVRIAALLHMATHWRASSPAAWERAIERETVEDAIRLGRYLLSHAQAAYAQMGADPEIEQAKFVLAWLTARGKTSFTLRELFQGTKGRFRRVAALRPALAILVEHGFIREGLPVSHPGPGRKPSPSYTANPFVYSQNPQNTQNASADVERQGDANREDAR